jgi:hypothetical protein
VNEITTQAAQLCQAVLELKPCEITGLEDERGKPSSRIAHLSVSYLQQLCVGQKVDKAG